jgi:uncharacterized protein YjbI with pentapeptide repeats
VSRDDTAPRAPAEPDLPDDLVALAVDPAALRGSRLAEARLAHVDLSDAARRAADVRDVLVEEGSWANARASGLALRRVELRGVRMTGADLGGAELCDVAFVDCRLDLVSLRQARLERVCFRGCRLEELDLGGARLESVLFEDCSLRQAELSAATLVRCELRRCDLAGLGGAERLAGVRLTLADAIASAPVLAAALGIRIVE